MWLTTKEASKLLGISERSVRRQAKSGKLKSKTEFTGKGRGGKTLLVWIDNITNDTNDTKEIKIILNDNEYHTMPINEIITCEEAEKKGICNNCKLATLPHPIDNSGRKYCSVYLLRSGQVIYKKGDVALSKPEIVRNEKALNERYEKIARLRAAFCEKALSMRDK